RPLRLRSWDLDARGCAVRRDIHLRKPRRAFGSRNLHSVSAGVERKRRIETRRSEDRAVERDTILRPHADRRDVESANPRFELLAMRTSVDFTFALPRALRLDRNLRELRPGTCHTAFALVTKCEIQERAYRRIKALTLCELRARSMNIPRAKQAV